MSKTIEMMDTYGGEFKEEMVFDEFHIHELMQKLPVINHKWVARMIRYKDDLNKIKRLKEGKKKELYEYYKSTQIVNMSDAALYRKIDACDDIKKINRVMEDTKLMIEYLSGIVDICRRSGYDVKNIIEWIKLETT